MGVKKWYGDVLFDELAAAVVAGPNARPNTEVA
jgi:hypothetical protein